MTNQEAIKMLTAKVECIRREISGIDVDCNFRNCDSCEFFYAQGTTGEQRKALNMAISALQAQEAKAQPSAEGTTPKVKKTCITCKHYPPESKWPCINCDMRNPADGWEPQELYKNSPKLDKGNGELHPTCTGNCTESKELKQEAKNSNESSLTQKGLDTISRQMAIDILNQYALSLNPDKDSKELWKVKSIKSFIEQLPSTQPEIIKCKDCFKHHESGLCEGWSRYGTITTRDDGWCAWAERRSDGTD